MGPHLGAGEGAESGTGVVSAAAVAAAVVVGTSTRPAASVAAVAGPHRRPSAVHSACSPLEPAGHSRTPGTGHTHNHTAEPSLTHFRVLQKENRKVNELE